MILFGHLLGRRSEWSQARRVSSIIPGKTPFSWPLWARLLGQFVERGMVRLSMPEKSIDFPPAQCLVRSFAHCDWRVRGD